jgi:hypothetical protein
MQKTYLPLSNSLLDCPRPVVFTSIWQVFSSHFGHVHVLYDAHA